MTEPTQPQQPMPPQQFQQQPPMQQPMPPQQPSKPKKPLYKRFWFWLIVVVIVAIIGSQLGGNKGGNTTSSSTPAKSGSTSSQSASASSDASTAKVEMQATATGKGSVIWGEAGSTNSEDFNQTWAKTITGEEAKKGYVLTVTGDIMGGNDQKVSCTVLVNGQQKSHKEGSGQSGSAMCDTTGIFN